MDEATTADDEAEFVCLLCPTDDQTPIEPFRGSWREVEEHINESHPLMDRVSAI